MFIFQLKQMADISFFNGSSTSWFLKFTGENFLLYFSYTSTIFFEISIFLLSFAFC